MTSSSHVERSNTSIAKAMGILEAVDQRRRRSRPLTANCISKNRHLPEKDAAHSSSPSFCPSKGSMPFKRLPISTVSMSRPGTAPGAVNSRVRGWSKQQILLDCERKRVETCMNSPESYMRDVRRRWLNNKRPSLVDLAAIAIQRRIR